MGMNVKNRLIQLEYEWDAVNKTHKLTWDTDYPINVTGIVTKVFKPYHEFTVGDKVTINDEPFTFTTLGGIAARNNAFTPNQYVPIAIDLDEKNIAYYAGLNGSGGSGGGEVIRAQIGFNEWNSNKQYLIPVLDLSNDAIVVLSMDPESTEAETKCIVESCIEAQIVTQGILLTATTVPGIDIKLHVVLL